MSIAGNLETMPLADLIQFLGLGRKTGVLRVETVLGSKRLVVEAGIAVYCSSDDPKEYLGQHLLARTNLTEADIAAAFRIQAQGGQKLGEILVLEGYITAEEIDTVLRHKIEDAMFELFTWTAGRFEFIEGSIAGEDVPVRLRLAWADLVMEGARRLDEMARVRQVIPTNEARCATRRDRFKPGFPRSGGDKRLIELIEQGLKISDILPRFHASDFDILLRLASLVRDGVLEVDASKAKPAEAPIETPDADLARAALLLQAERTPEAWAILVAAARRFPKEPALGGALAACEVKLRRRFAQEFGDRSALVALRVPLESLMGMKLDSKEAFLATRITGDWPLSSVVQLCPFDELEALCLIEALMQKGLIELRAPVRA